jgi:hemoglobin-like flavoprotein
MIKSKIIVEGQSSSMQNFSTVQKHSSDKYLHPRDCPDLDISFSAQEITLLRQVWRGMRQDPVLHDRSGFHSNASAFFCQQFYDNLLAEHPELRTTFPAIKSQASAMAGILSLVISQLENLSRVDDILVSLGKRHARIIGADVVHFEMVGQALLKTLQDRCRQEFTFDVENSWIKLYSYIANVMLQAGEDSPLPVLEESPLPPSTEPNRLSTESPNISTVFVRRSEEQGTSSTTSPQTSRSHIVLVKPAFKNKLKRPGPPDDCILM